MVYRRIYSSSEFSSEYNCEMLFRALVAAAATAAALAPPRSPPPTCSVSYYTKREAQQLQQAQRAIVRAAGGVLGGAACGAGLHVAADALVPLASWASLIDSTVDTVAGGLVGAILGVLWASEAALLRTGAAPAYMRDSLRPLMRNATADESLAQMTLGLSTMATRGDTALRLAFYLTGLDDEAAVMQPVHRRREVALAHLVAPATPRPSRRLVTSRVEVRGCLWAARGVQRRIGTCGSSERLERGAVPHVHVTCACT